MNIAIFGATSYLARDLMLSFSRKSNVHIDLYGRSVEPINNWLYSKSLEKKYVALHYDAFNSELPYDAIINFVGLGNPALAAASGASIFDITLQYDTLALDYIQKNKSTKYIFVSSGAVYGSVFSEPINVNCKASIDINHIDPTDYYGVAKLYAEIKHRSFTDLNIVDVRVFNYFSSTMDLTTRFFISDILRAIRDHTTLLTTANNIYRDYLHPDDFYQLIQCVLSGKKLNLALDCYTKAPIDKLTLLDEMKIHFGLNFALINNEQDFGINATGLKDHYYSLNRRAESLSYQPTRTSLESILHETNLILKSD